MLQLQMLRSCLLVWCPSLQSSRDTENVLRLERNVGLAHANFRPSIVATRHTAADIRCARALVHIPQFTYPHGGPSPNLLHFVGLDGARGGRHPGLPQGVAALRQNHYHLWG
jgi:hypothetical protein